MILLVDDRPENILPLKRILEYNKFQVDSALSGEEALKKVLKNDYFLIILDVQMPGMDGFEVAEALSGNNRSKDIPIIFLSAVNTDKKFITKGYESGGFDYVTKPVDPDILILKVKTFYRLYQQTKALNMAQDALKAEVEFRRQAQNELRETAQQLRSILESIPQIAFTASAQGKIEYANQHWYEYSANQETFPTMHPADEPAMMKKWKHAIASGQPLEMEVRIRKLFSEDFCFFLLRAIPVSEEDKIVKWVGTFTDIEEQKQAERKKDEFMSIASHELKTPLTSIKAYFQLLERSVKDLKSPDLVKYVSKTSDQIDRLNGLVSDLLDVSKIESGKLLFDKKEFEFEPLLDSVIDSMQQMHDHRIVKKGNAKVKVYGDAARIEQVLINYISNAVKYSPGEKEVIVETAMAPDQQLEVKVRDFGIGIPEGKLDNMFQKFYRVEESAARFQGLGIGLYICAQIIKSHNGKYGVTSTRGEGSEFYFTIPLYQDKV
jgi:signal transduction histidine kinase